MPAADINATIDGNPGSTFDLVRIASDVDEQTARLISEAGSDLPGVEVAVEARRQYADGPLMSQILGYTGSGLRRAARRRSSSAGYLPDDLIGKAGVEAQYETELRGVYGTRERRAGRLGSADAGPPDASRDAQPGDSLTLTIDTKEQQNAQKALQWAMKEVGIKRGVVIVMNPQTGEILALVSLPTYDNNQFARGISNADYAKLLNNPDKPLLNHAIQAHYPPGSTYKLVAGTGALADKKITAEHARSGRAGYLTLGGDAVLRLEPPRLRGRATSTAASATRATRSSSRWPASSASTGSATGPSSTASAHRPASTSPARSPGSSRPTQWKQDALGAPIFPRRDVPGGDRPGL